MVKQLIGSIKLHKQTPLILLACLLGFFLLGFILICIILGTDPTAVFWFDFGTICSVIGVVIFAVISFMSYHQDFMLALSLGKMRREFMILYALEQLVWMLLAYVGILLVSLLERAVYPVIFPGAYEGFSLFPYLTNWCIAIPAILALVLIPMFLGALYSRFGRKFTVILYIIWMAACLLGPGLANHFDELDGSVQQSLGNAFSWLAAIPVFGWVVIGIATAAVMVFTIIYLGLKQMVR